MAPSSTTRGRARPAPDAAPPADVAGDVEQPPAPRWWAFTGPYPVDLVARALHVEPGDTVEWPDGPPDLEHWQPAAPPTDSTGDAGSEES